MKKLIDKLSFLNDNKSADNAQSKKEACFFTDKNGKSHVANWFNKLDRLAKSRILDRIRKIKYGVFGDYKKIDYKLFELKFFFRKGYRIYFTEKENKIVFLPNAGDKDSQSRDIKKAKLLLKEFLSKEDKND